MYWFSWSSTYTTNQWTTQRTPTLQGDCGNHEDGTWSRCYFTRVGCGPFVVTVLLGLNPSWPIPLRAQPVTSKPAQKSVPSKPASSKPAPLKLAPSQSAPLQSTPLQSALLQSALSQLAPLQSAPHGKTRSGVIPAGSGLPHKVQASGLAEHVLRLNKKNTLTNADARAQEEANRLLGKKQGSRTWQGGCK